MSSADLVDRAHQLRKKAHSQECIIEVEQVLQSAWKSKVESAFSPLVLLLCQEGKDDEAKKLLKGCGYLYRLSREILHYRLPPSPSPPSSDHSKYVFSFDNALPPSMYKLMKSAFSFESPFWREHNYNCDKSDYFSYLHPLYPSEEHSHNKSALDTIISTLFQLAITAFPEAKKARFAEWWAHCRPHSSGHQLHFDSDNEGRGGIIKNPIVSSVLYLSYSIGGPTLVTTQAFTDQKLAEKGWFVFPKENRYALFRGNVLHGVIPGRSFSTDPGKHRVTFMVAFWEDIMYRDTESLVKPGASMHFPNSSTNPRNFTWPDAFSVNLSAETQHDHHNTPPVEILDVKRVWADVDERVNDMRGCSVKDLTYLPSYDLCFQGF